MANTTVKAYSVGGAVGIAIGLMGAGIQLRWPDKNVGTWLIVAGSAVLAAAVIAWIVRAMTIREYERTHMQSGAMSIPAQQLTQTANPHNEFKPSNVVNVHVPVSQKQSQQQIQPAHERAPSIFEATDNARIVIYGLDGRDGKLINERYYGDEADLPDYIQLVHTALAQFHYRHDANVEPRLSLAAHVYPYSKNQLPLKPIVYHAVWNNADYDRQIDVLPGKVFDLIVALFKRNDAEGICLYEHGTKRIDFGYGTKDVMFSPQLLDVHGTDFFIKIELAPKCWSDPLPKQEFWFRLILGESLEFAKLDRSPLDISTDMK